MPKRAARVEAELRMTCAELAERSVIAEEMAGREAMLREALDAALAERDEAFERSRQQLEGLIALRTDELRHANEQLVLNGIARREMAEALRESEERYRGLIELSPDAVLVAGHGGAILFANEAGATLLGAGVPEDLLGRPLLDHVAAVHKDTARRRLARAGQQGPDAEFVAVELLRCDGKHVFAELAAIAITYQGEPAVQLVARDVTERRRADRFREEYLSLISHDLRTPLTTVLGTADWLRRRLEKNGLTAEARGADMLLTSARRMEGMIRDLVESVRLESGRLELRCEPVDLAGLVGDLAKRIGTHEDRRRIEIAAAEPVPAVRADPARLERAIANLVTNALKYSSPDQRVTICVEPRSDCALLSVADRGEGIAPDDLPHIFDRSFRSKSAGKREGLGLGLYITRLIAEAHGGRVCADSAVGKGSRFWLELPYA